MHRTGGSSEPTESSAPLSPLETAQERYKLILSYVSLGRLLGSCGDFLAGDANPCQDKAFLQNLWYRAEEAHALAGQPDIDLRDEARTGLDALFGKNVIKEFLLQ